MSEAAEFDVVVVGAGPAGLAAAAAAAEAGASVGLVDANARIGGQYWRHSPGTPNRHHHAARFRALADRITAAGVVHLPHHHVVTALGSGNCFALNCAVGAEPRQGGPARSLTGRRLVLATGAYDRQLPFAGWELPGVLAAGAVQALLKAHGVLAGRKIVVAGTGPFLLPVSAALLAAGARVPAVVEANSPAGFLRHPRALLGAAGRLGEAAGYGFQLARARTPYLRRRAVVRVLGTDEVEAVEIARLDTDGSVRPGSTTTVECDTVAVGWGFTPQLELHLQLGCATHVARDASLVVIVDEAQRTTVSGVWAAGESTGVGGAELAVAEGEIAGRHAAGVAYAEPRIARRLAARRAALRRFADALHAVHPVPRFLLDDLGTDTLLCRCEEIPAGAVRDAVRELGATDARTVKLLCRPGMGWCQGRVCGYATAAVTAHANGRAVRVDDLRALAERPFAAPISLGLLADPTSHGAQLSPTSDELLPRVTDLPSE
jgi:D-hydroxyproline dehydrogenase subunit alpha